MRSRIVRTLCFPALAVSALSVAAPAALAQAQTGTLLAACQYNAVSYRIELRYTRYRDGVVWQDRFGLGAEVTDMQQWGTTHWEGVLDTNGMRYSLTGQNQFIEAWPVGGVYSDMVTLEFATTGPATFTIRDFYNNGPRIPCQIIG